MMNNDTELPAFVGSGWTFPPTFDPLAQTVQMAENRREIEESLHILLSTIPGERVMRPKYGCDLTPLLFEPISTGLQTTIEDRVRTSIYLYEPRIKPLSVTINVVNAIEGQFLIEVNYQIRANNTRYNFVFPYYREEGTEVS